MKTHVAYQIVVVGLMLLSLASCKKEEPTITPGGTTPGATKSSAKEISAFTFSALSPVVSATVNASAKTIAATVPNSIDVTKLVPTITVSDKATVSPASGIAQDFTKTITYTVTAEDGSTQTYAVTISKESATSSVCRVATITGTSTTGGSKITYQVDSQNRLVQSKTESTDKNGAITSSSTMVNTYDADGFLTSQITSYSYAASSQFNIKNITNRYTYQNGRLVSNDFALVYVDPSTAGSSSTNQYEYDTQGNVSKRIVTSSSGLQETYTYANGAVTGITGNQATFTLNAQGFMTKRLNTNGSYILYQYNAAGQQTRLENYDTKGVKTGYTTYQYTASILATPTNPIPLKGHPTNIPSANGASAQTEKMTTYTVDAAGKETKTNEVTYVYQGNSKGNVASYMYTNSFLSGTTMITTITTYTYDYQGCQ